MSIYSKLTGDTVYHRILGVLGLKSADPGLTFTTRRELDREVSFLSQMYSVDQTGTAAPVLTLIGASDAVVAGADTTCRPGTCKCKSITDHTFCSAACCSTATYVSPGIYIITLASAPTNGFDVIVGSGKEAYYSFAVEKIDSKSFYLKSYSSVPGPAGYANDVFNDTYLEIKLWKAPVVSPH